MIKQWFCRHKYKNIGLYYTIEKYLSIYNIELYKHERCKKCEKEKNKIIGKFKTYEINEFYKIIYMLERHGAVYYADYINKVVDNNE